MNKLKEKWGIKSNFQLLIILFVFSITGSLTLIISKPLLTLLGIEKDILSVWIFWPIRILIIFPTYQILILIVGAIFGQFNFFWKFEKRMLARLGLWDFKDNE
tara:strand:- start:103 stop:411 length:309 start_codon:yes stop_codon:yes gene_type:complete